MGQGVSLPRGAKGVPPGLHFALWLYQAEVHAMWDSQCWGKQPPSPLPTPSPASPRRGGGGGAPSDGPVYSCPHAGGKGAPEYCIAW